MRGWGAHLPRTPPCGRSSSLVPYASLSIRTTQSLPPINGWRPVLVIPSGQSGHANERPNTCPSRSSRRGTAFLGRSQPGWRPPPATPPRRAEPAPERARGLPPPRPRQSAAHRSSQEETSAAVGAGVGVWASSSCNSLAPSEPAGGGYTNTAAARDEFPPCSPELGWSAST